MDKPFEKFIIHAVTADTFTVHVQISGLIPQADSNLYNEYMHRRRDFIEEAIREKLQRGGQS
jgi:hypothetical protein